MISLINVFTVDPANQHWLLDLLARAAVIDDIEWKSDSLSKGRKHIWHRSPLAWSLREPLEPRSHSAAPAWERVKSDAAGSRDEIADRVDDESRDVTGAGRHPVTMQRSDRSRLANCGPVQQASLTRVS